MEDIDIIVELIGGSEGVAKKLVFSALRNKKHVITSNKSLMAKYCDQLAALAEKNNAKQAKLEAKGKKKEEKYLAKQIEQDQAEIIKKKTSKQSVNTDAGIESPTSISPNFNKLVEKITKRNILRPYPNINDIQD